MSSPPKVLRRPVGRHHYSLGIEGLWFELAAMRCPGVYWLLADRPADADALILGMLADAGDEARVDWIAAQDHARQTASLLDDGQGPGWLSFFGLPREMTAGAWLALPGDLSRVRRWRRSLPRLVILELETSDIDGTLNDEELIQWCQQWRNWAVMHRACVTIITHGGRGLALRGRLLPHNDALDGLVHLQPVGEEGRFLVIHWRSDLGAYGARDLLLAAERLGLRLVSSTPWSEAGGSDEHEVLVQRNVMQGAPALSEHWHVHDTPREVVAQAANALAATVILGVKRADEIEEVARWVHDLRVQRGNAIKLVVRELASCLRYRDNRLLSLCGVTLVVEHTMSLSQFLSHLEGIQGQRFNRQINSDFEGIVASLRPIAPGGVVSPAIFLDRTGQWLDSLAAEAVSSLLVALQPAGGLSADQALRQCSLSRYGDMATLMEGRLYLFLFGCRLVDLDAALKRLLGLSDAALFASREVFDERDTVALEVQRLITQGWDDMTEDVTTSVPAHRMELGQPYGAEPLAATPRPVVLQLHAVPSAVREAPRS